MQMQTRCCFGCPKPRAFRLPGKMALPETRWSEKKACTVWLPRRASSTALPASRPAPLSRVCAGGSTCMYADCQAGMSTPSHAGAMLVACAGVSSAWALVPWKAKELTPVVPSSSVGAARPPGWRGMAKRPRWALPSMYAFICSANANKVQPKVPCVFKEVRLYMNTKAHPQLLSS